MEKLKNPLLRVPLISLGIGLFLRVFQVFFFLYMRNMNHIDINALDSTGETYQSIMTLHNGLMVFLALVLLFCTGMVYMKGIRRKQAALSAGIVAAYGALLYILRLLLPGWHFTTAYDIASIPLGAYNWLPALLGGVESLQANYFAGLAVNIIAIALPFMYVAFARPAKAKAAAQKEDDK